MINIESYEPPREFTPWIHRAFAALYLLLVLRALVAVYEGPVDFSKPPPVNSLPVLMVKRMAGIAYGPFNRISSVGSFASNSDLFGTIVLALLLYGLIHYGMVMKIEVEGRLSMADRILKLCRAIFFLVGTLMLLLVVARMSVMLYQDVFFGRGLTIIRSPAQR